LGKVTTVGQNPFDSGKSVGKIVDVPDFLRHLAQFPIQITDAKTASLVLGNPMPVTLKPRLGHFMVKFRLSGISRDL
jgi:hypothetical protein